MTTLHVVGGFLGSGKTTAIAAAARLLLASGQRVGVITNDQGKYLVDTAFFKAEHLPTVEVTGGCFCCNYDDLDARFAELRDRYQPDVVFAESVGSCADVVATVIKPLLTLNSTRASLSVFADSRLLYRRLRGEELPFADDIIYIFDKQLEEADLIVINKIDLLGDEAQDEIAERAKRQFAGKRILMHNAHSPGSVRRWLDLLLSAAAPVLDASLDIDYQRYGEGEADLAWLDAEIELNLAKTARRDLVGAFLGRLEQNLRAERIPIGHIKLVITDGELQTKFSLTAVSDPGWEASLPSRQTDHLRILLNARAQTSAIHLESVTREALEYVLEGQAPAHWIGQFFHPDLPKPTHRLP